MLPGDDVTVYGVMYQRWKPFNDGSPCIVELVLRANNIEVYNQHAAATSVIKDAQKEFEDFWADYTHDPIEGKLKRKKKHFQEEFLILQFHAISSPPPLLQLFVMAIITVVSTNVVLAFFFFSFFFYRKEPNLVKPVSTGIWHVFY